MRKTLIPLTVLLLAAVLPRAQAGADLVHPRPQAEEPACVEPAGPSACPGADDEGWGTATRCGEGPGGAPGRLWGSAEYLLWWIKDSAGPALVTTSTPAGAGILGRDSTTVLFGGPGLDRGERSGGRFFLGAWLDREDTLGFEAGYLFLGSRSVHFGASSTGDPGTPVLARPFFDVGAGAQNSELVAFPGLLAGSVNVLSSSRLQGWEANGSFNLCRGCRGRLDVLAGFRYLQLDEGLGILEDLTANPAVPALGGTGFVVADQFDTSNRFYGGQLGARAEVQSGKWFASSVAKVALGGVREVVRVDGSTAITPPGGTTTVNSGGLLALPPNLGRFTHSEFAVVPEGGVAVGYQATRWLRASVGYTFLYCSAVARPANQINTSVVTTQLPLTLPVALPAAGPAPSAFTLRETDFWAQGLTFGLELRY